MQKESSVTTMFIRCFNVYKETEEQQDKVFLDLRVSLQVKGRVIFLWKKWMTSLPVRWKSMNLHQMMAISEYFRIFPLREKSAGKYKLENLIFHEF